MSALAALAAAAAAALLVPYTVRPGPARLMTQLRGLSAIVVAAAAVTVGALLAFAEGTTLALGLIAVGGLGAAFRLVSSQRQRRSADSVAEVVLELSEALAGELRAGQPPVAALQHGAELWPDFAPVATAARLGSDVPTALRTLGRRPGAGALRDLASAWQVSGETGAGLALALTQVTASVRDARATQRVVSAELASAQATARLVAALPLLALMMGSGVGGDPWAFLLGTPAGLVCLALGLGFGFAGLLWIERIAAGVAVR